MPISKADIQELLRQTSGPSSDFDLNTDVVPVAETSAAVLVALIERPSGVHLILTKRAAHLKSHPGQIAFPGGKADEIDTDIVATATREAWEEVGLPPENLTILGCLPVHTTVTGFAVTPVVAWVDCDWRVVIDAGEVAELFEVPLDFVMKQSNFKIQGRRWRGHKRWYYTIPYGPYYIWGATARILRGMAERMTR